jgi:hypothetical protein
MRATLNIRLGASHIGAGKLAKNPAQEKTDDD